ncbi:MAG: DUF4440 domain-containing protein [Bacteroidota bacterium]
MRPITSLLIGIFLFAGFSFGQTFNGKQKDIDQILANIKAFSKAYMNSDTEALVNSYTEDGKIFPGNRMIMGGRKDLTAYWTVPAGVKILHHKITPEEITIVKKFAYDYGYYEGKTRGKDGKESSWKGKYVIVWRKVGKEWKIYLDIWNRVQS